MAVNPLIVLGIIQGIGGGITALIQQDKVNKAVKANVELIDKQLNDVKTFVEDNSYSEASINEALSRIGTMIDTAKSEVKASIQLGVESSIKQMQEAYKWSSEDLSRELGNFNQIMNKESETFRKDWKEGFDKMADTLARGRLLRSGFGTTLSKKALKDLNLGEEAIAEKRADVQKTFAQNLSRLGEQLQGNIRTAQMEGASRIAQGLAELTLRGGKMGEETRARMEDVNRQLAQFGLEQQIAGEQQKGLLESQKTEGDFWSGVGTFFTGAFGTPEAAANIAAGLTPDKSKLQTQKQEQQAKASFLMGA